ncbi:MAG: hypothetical protein HGA42_20455 [Nostocales cyanobacterium W4_Combined_metabat2_030]|nr:hypothetical protein [Nostocales cyanobacterium W4_Combined_metabat2_030]
MAKTYEEITAEIIDKIKPKVKAVDHRLVEQDILDYAKDIQDSIPTGIIQSNVSMLISWIADRNYNVSTTIPDGKTLLSVQCFLQCKVANNGFIVGDIVTAPTPYPQDSGRTAAQGIGLQFKVNDPTSIKVITNDHITIMTAYNATSGANGNNVLVNPSDWSIRLVIF